MSHANLTLVPHREEEEEEEEEEEKEEGTRLPLRGGEMGGHFTTVCGGRKGEEKNGRGDKGEKEGKRTLFANVHHSSHYSKLRTAH